MWHSAWEPLSPLAAGGAIFSSSSSSFDGGSWTEQTSGVTNDLSSVAFGNGQFVAVSRDDPLQWTDQAILRSVDGKTWLRTSAPPRGLVSVAFGGGRFVAIGYNTTVTSSDGITWNAVDQFNPGLRCIAYGNGQFVAVGSAGIRAGRVAISNDGITWTVQNIGIEVMEDLTFADGTFIGIGHGSTGIIRNYLFCTSTNGLNWEIMPLPGFFFGLAYGNGTYVAVGGGGFIAQSGQIRAGPRFLPSYLKRNLRATIGIAVESPINSIIRLEAGTDLRTWTELLRATNLSGVLEFEDQTSPGLPYRFYRASEIQR
jgi:hypothetical protein